MKTILMGPSGQLRPKQVEKKKKKSVIRGRDDVTQFNKPLINSSVNLQPKLAAADFRVHPSKIQADCT